MTQIRSTFNLPASVSGKVILFALFLIPALLLWTPNFSIIITGLLSIYAIRYCFKIKKDISFESHDWLVLAIFLSYFIINLPNVLIDTGNFRYIEGPSKILLSFPIYLMLKRELPSLKPRPWLESGVIIGAIGAFGIACYQFFILNYPRVDGFLFSINFGYLACSLAFLNLCLIPQSTRKTWLALGFTLAIIATVLTLTRGAIFAIPILGFIFLFLQRRSLNKKYVLISLLTMFIAAYLSYQYSPSIKNRINYTAQEINAILSGNIAEAQSSGGRLGLWYAATQALKKSPLRGLTYNERITLNKQLIANGEVTDWVQQVGRGHAHSQYFEMLASNGLSAIVAIVLLFGVPLLLLYNNQHDTFAVTGFVFICGIAIFGLTEVLLQANLISVYFGVFLAFFLASSTQPTHPRSTIFDE